MRSVTNHRPRRAAAAVLILCWLAVWAVFLPGCSAVTTGIKSTQKGLALVDVGIKTSTEAYAVAVLNLRAYCGGDPECERRFKVDDASVARVEIQLERAANGYDAMAEGADDLADAWSEIEPEMRAIIERAKELRQ